MPQNPFPTQPLAIQDALPALNFQQGFQNLNNFNALPVDQNEFFFTDFFNQFGQNLSNQNFGNENLGANSIGKPFPGTATSGSSPTISCPYPGIELAEPKEVLQFRDSDMFLTQSDGIRPGERILPFKINQKVIL